MDEKTVCPTGYQSFKDLLERGTTDKDEIDPCTRCHDTRITDDKK